MPKKIKRLTDNLEYEGSPAVSHDGYYIAYVSEVTGNKDIFIIDFERKNCRQITFNKSTDFSSSFGVADKVIYFTSFQYDNKSRIFMIPR